MHSHENRGNERPSWLPLFFWSVIRQRRTPELLLLSLLQCAYLFRYGQVGYVLDSDHFTHIRLYLLDESNGLVIDIVHAVTGREGRIEIEVGFATLLLDQSVHGREVLKTVSKEGMTAAWVCLADVVLQRLERDLVVLHEVALCRPAAECFKPDRTASCKDLYKITVNNIKLDRVEE